MTTFLKHADTYVPGARTLPGRCFTSPDVYTEELEKIFYRSWLCVGRVDQIPQRGDYFLRAVGGESIIVVHDRQDQLRAFYNVCRHRGTRLCEAARGRLSETIQCPYHAWTYALDGRLVGAPFMQEVPGFDKQDYGLHRVALAQWDAIEFWDMTNRQDWHICELSQQGIASHAYSPGPYSPRESIPAAWDRNWQKVVGRPA